MLFRYWQKLSTHKHSLLFKWQRKLSLVRMQKMRQIISRETIHRIELAFKAYWLSPFCSGTVQLGEILLSWALKAEMLASKSYADMYNPTTKIAYQIKTGLPASPVTFARLTTASQFSLVNSSDLFDCEILGGELLDWVRNRIEEPKTNLGAKEVRIARIIYTKSGDFTYYERLVDPTLYDPATYTWKWSSKGNALEGYKGDEKWFSWYPQGRRGAKNQNQLHYHGENRLIPPEGSGNRHDFSLGRPAQIDFNDMLNALLNLIEKNAD